MSSTRRQFLAAGLAGVSQVAAAEETAPTPEDAAVIAAFLSALLESPDFIWDDRREADSVILLRVRAPEKTGMLGHQMLADTRDGHALDPEMVRSIRERNTKPGTEHDGIETSFAAVRWDLPVVVGDTALRPGEHEWEMMKRLHPKAVAWAASWLPGYGGDGNRALARCWWGPWPHGATATAELTRDGADWKIDWIKLSVYA